MADMKKDYYQEVTNEIIKAIEEGTTPWQQGWDSKVGAAIAAVPINGKTGRPYYKDNLIRLSIVMRRHGNSKDPRFFTFKQAKDMGYSIKKGAKSTLIRMGFYAEKDLEGNELPEDEKHWTNRSVHPRVSSLKPFLKRMETWSNAREASSVRLKPARSYRESSMIKTVER